MENNVEKVVYGSNLTVLSFNGIGSIPIFYGGHILVTELLEGLITENNYNLRTGEEITSINITIENADSTSQRTYSFPLQAGQILSGNDYIDSDGLHIGNDVIAFTSEQVAAYEALQNIPLYEGITHIIVTDTTPVVLKLSYTSNEGQDEKIYVLDKNENLLAVFDKDDEETLINPRIEKKQNSESIFTFTIDINNSKWKEISNPENLYLVDGMVFSPNFDGSFTERVSENDEKTIEVTAYERQQLLSRKFVRAWNSETNLSKIDTFMVVILSNGNLPLKNNGIEVPTRYPKGSSGYVLEGLLYGTGWTVGTCDIYEYEDGELVTDKDNNPVYLKFDFETDQMNIYDNILKIQELWGGILVFDSLNKIVHHRDETRYLPYNGYEVKYQKNMQSLEKAYNNKIITKLCPLGEGGLNIKRVNNDSVWLENYEYTDTVLEGIENNPDITNPKQLKKWGERKLEMLCKPSIELDVKVALLYQVEGYELETVDLNDIVRVIGYQKIYPSVFVSENTILAEDRIIGGVSFEDLRIIEFSYSVWDKSDATIKLSNITLDSTDIFKKTISATNSINSGTLDASKVTTLYNGGESVEKTVSDIDKNKLDGDDFTGKNIIDNINNDESGQIISGDKIDINGKAVHFKTNIVKTVGPFEEEDVIKLQSYLMDGAELTEEEKQRYDSNEDGKLNSGDLFTMMKAVDNGGYYTYSGSYEIDPYSFNKSLRIFDNNANKFRSIFSLIYNYIDYLYTEGINLKGHLEVMPSGVKGGMFTDVFNSDERFELFIDGDLHVSHNITCEVLIQTSKAENKKNFEKLNNALDIIKSIDIYKYNMKSQQDGDKKHIGFVIGKDFKYNQEITSSDNNNVDIYSFVSTCCQAIKEIADKQKQQDITLNKQQEQIEQMKREIKKMKGEDKNEL